MGLGAAGFFGAALRALPFLATRLAAFRADDFLAAPLRCLAAARFFLGLAFGLPLRAAEARLLCFFRFLAIFLPPPVIETTTWQPLRRLLLASHLA